jgi:hypothetical protein
MSTSKTQSKAAFSWWKNTPTHQSTTLKQTQLTTYQQ